MLPRENRLRTADEFKMTVRRGKRIHSGSLVTYIRSGSESEQTHPRFGFIVAKQVGVAVVRNTVRRRLRAACFDLRERVIDGVDIVIRALPPAAAQPYAVLYDEVTRSLAKGSVLR